MRPKNGEKDHEQKSGTLSETSKEIKKEQLVKKIENAAFLRSQVNEVGQREVNCQVRWGINIDH